MSKTALVFFTLLLVFASCFIAGCSSFPFSDTPSPVETLKKANMGFATVKTTGGVPSSQRLQFESTLASVLYMDIFTMEQERAGNESGVINSYKIRIKNIRGTGLDENGNASSWTFIVEHGDKFSIITATSQDKKASTSPGTIDMAEIDMDKVMSPGKLFEKNRAIIFKTAGSGTTESRDLTLNGGSYTLSISGQDTPRILVFDATTGVLTS